MQNSRINRACLPVPAGLIVMNAINLNKEKNNLLKDLFFGNDMTKKLDEDQKQSCEGLLTENERRNALKGFQKNKTPGTDGLTAEFYIFFGEKLGKIMVNSYDYGFQKGELSWFC